MDKDIKKFLKFIKVDKKLSKNTLESYQRDILQYKDYINIIDYKLIKQYDKKEDIKKELKASIKTIDNIIYKSFDHYEKRLKDFQDLILISDKITLEELTA